MTLSFYDKFYPFKNFLKFQDQDSWLAVNSDSTYFNEESTP